MPQCWLRTNVSSINSGLNLSQSSIRCHTVVLVVDDKTVSPAACHHRLNYCNRKWTICWWVWSELWPLHRPSARKYSEKCTRMNQCKTWYSTFCGYHPLAGREGDPVTACKPTTPMAPIQEYISVNDHCRVWICEDWLYVITVTMMCLILTSLTAVTLSICCFVICDFHS